LGYLQNDRDVCFVCQFLDLCRNVTDNDTRVIELLQHRYSNTNPHFLWSENFGRLLNECSKKITSDLANKFVHIQQLVEDLKAYKATPLKHLLRSADKPPVSPNDEPLSKRSKLEETAAVQQPSAVETKGCTLIPLSDIPDQHSAQDNKLSREQSDCCIIDICDEADEAEQTGISDVQPEVSPAASDRLENASALPLKCFKDGSDESVVLPDTQMADHQNDYTVATSTNYEPSQSTSSHVSRIHIERLENLLQVMY
jgi:hypothetical protein